MDDLDLRVSRLVSVLETEREHRRSDSERHHAALSDVMDSLQAERTLRIGEAPIGLGLVALRSWWIASRIKLL